MESKDIILTRNSFKIHTYQEYSKTSQKMYIMKTLCKISKFLHQNEFIFNSIFHKLLKIALQHSLAEVSEQQLVFTWMTVTHPGGAKLQFLYFIILIRRTATQRNAM